MHKTVSFTVQQLQKENHKYNKLTNNRLCDLIPMHKH